MFSKFECNGLVSTKQELTGSYSLFLFFIFGLLFRFFLFLFLVCFIWVRLFLFRFFSFSGFVFLNSKKKIEECNNDRWIHPQTKSTIEVLKVIKKMVIWLIKGIRHSVLNKNQEMLYKYGWFLIIFKNEILFYSRAFKGGWLIDDFSFLRRSFNVTRLLIIHDFQ